MSIRDRVQRVVAVIRGWREISLALIVMMSAPICVTWAREAFTTEKPLVLVPVAPVTLAAVAEPETLHTRYGLSIVAMPEPPSHSAMVEMHEAAGNEGRRAEDRITDDRKTEDRITDHRSPMTDLRDPRSEAFSCPDVRAIVTGDEAFAILAWDDASFVAKPGQSLSTPCGDVKLQRLRPRSLTLTHGEETLQCSLKR